MSPGMLAPPPPPAEQRRQSMRPPCSNLFLLLSAPMTKRRGSRGAHKRRGSRGAHRKGRHGGQRHQRSADAQQRRAAKWSSVLRTRLRGRLARLPVRRVLLGNGVRLCPQCPLPDDREGFLERAVRDVAARVGGTPHRRTTPDGRSVKPPGRHACCQVWEVRLPEGVAVVSLTDWNQGRRVAVPYIWIQARYGLVLQFARLFNP